MLEPKGMSLGTLLTDGQPSFEVPDYQGPYSWEREHVESLFNDLRVAFFESQRIHDERSYFLGPMVLVRRRDGGRTIYDIVDGQQRLTTLVILFSALRDALLQLNEKEAALRLDDGWVVKSSLRGAREARLTLRTENDNYFRERVVTLPDNRGTIIPRRGVRGRPPKNRVKNSYNLLKELLSDWLTTLDADKRVAQLVEFAEFIIHRSLIVVLLVDDIGYAHNIFETLNTRGLDLSIQDLVRNVLRQTGSKHVIAAWDDVEEKMEGMESGGGFRTFIRASWVARHGRVSFRDLFAEIRKFLNANPKDGATTLARQFQEDAPLFIEIVAPTYGDRATSVLESLEEMGLRQHIPFLLTAKRCFAEQEFGRALQLVESTTVRYLFAREGNPNQLEEFYVDAAHSIGNASTKAERAFSDLEKQAARDLMDDDKVFKEAFAGMVCERAAQARYLLTKLELHDNREFNLRSARDVHVEHILPKNPGSGWKRAFQTPQDFVNRLGNLTLLGEALNKGASNKPFVTKRDEYYKGSKLALTRELLKFSKWNEHEIEERQRRLADLAIKVWGRPGA